MIDVAYKVVAVLITLGVLVVIHELGHFWVARLAGVKVLRFSVGFGRILWSRPFGPDNTEWALSAIPLGGYVKMADEREGDVSARDLPRAFNRQSVWKRIAIVAAGPIANLLLAVLIFAGTYIAGIPGQQALLSAPPDDSAAARAGLRAGDLVVAVDDDPVRSWQDLRWRLVRAQGQESAKLAVERPESRGARTSHVLSLAAMKPADWEGNAMSLLGLKYDLGPPLIDQVMPGKPADRAGLKSGDRIVAIDGAPVRSPSDVAMLTNAKPGGELVFRVSRDGAQLDATLTAEAIEQGGRTVGIAGVRLRVDPAIAESRTVTVRYGPVEALVEGARKTWELSAFTLRMLGRIVTGDASVKNISGPLTMADFAGQSAQQGTLVFVGYLALISISLGVLNLLPVPLLDGGHLLYYFAELIK
ncbi:MAG: RIP metalloprotease RseP, partial [Casimicrobiaceae bacterium]